MKDKEEYWNLKKSLRDFSVTFMIFLVFRYFLAELILNNKPKLFEGTVKSACYGLAYLAAARSL